MTTEKKPKSWPEVVEVIAWLTFIAVVTWLLH